MTTYYDKMKQCQVLSLLACVASAAAQGVTDKIAPEATAPAGCAPSFENKFEISILELGNPTKRSEVSSDCLDPRLEPWVTEIDRLT